MTCSTDENLCAAIADAVVPKYRTTGRSYSCGGHIAYQWNAAYEGAARMLAMQASEMPTIWEDPAGKGYPCFERPMTPSEARQTIDRYATRIIELEQAGA